MAVLFVAGPAGAHWVAEKGEVYRSEVDCVEIRSEVSHGSRNAGFYKTEIQVWRELPHIGSQCSLGWTRPADHIAGLQQHWVQRPDNSVFICTATDWIYNSSSDDELTISVDHAEASPVCGGGWYLNRSLGFNLNGGDWNGGSIDSGWHALPVASSAARPDPHGPPEPLPAPADLPAVVPILDSDGDVLQTGDGRVAVFEPRAMAIEVELAHAEYGRRHDRRNRSDADRRRFERAAEDLFGAGMRSPAPGPEVSIIQGAGWLDQPRSRLDPRAFVTTVRPERLAELLAEGADR